MHVEVGREAFLAALNAVSPACPTKSPKPILQSVKFVAGGEFSSGDDGPALWATDLEVAIRHLVGGVKVIEPGAMILNPVDLKKICAKATCDTLSLRLDDGVVRVRGTKVKYDLASEDPNLYPEPPGFSEESYYVFAAADLKRLIRQTVYATDPDSTRYALNGVLLELRASQATAVATDGRRLSEAKSPVEVYGEPAEYVLPKKNAPVLPLKCLMLLQKSISDNDPPVHVAVKANSAFLVRTERSTIYSRLVEGRYPNYLQMFDNLQHAARPKFPAGVLREAVEQAAIVSSVESKGIRFTFEPGKLTIAGQAAAVGSSEVEAEIRYDGPKVEAVLAPEYVLEPIRAIGDDVEIEYRASPKEANMIIASGFTALVMPIG